MPSNPSHEWSGMDLDDLLNLEVQYPVAPPTKEDRDFDDGGTDHLGRVVGIDKGCEVG